MQKAIIINSIDMVEYLNEQLECGWKIIATCPMPSSIALTSSIFNERTVPPTCLVVIEKKS